MSARQNKKRKGRNHINNRERTVTTFTEDPNTSFLVPLSSEDPPAVLTSPFSPSSFAMPYQNYIPQQQQQFYQPVLPPGTNDLEILENLKTIIKEGQHEFYRAVPQPAALASLYVGPQARQDQSPQDHPTPRLTLDSPADSSNGPDATSQSVNNTVEAHTPGADTSPTKLGADLFNVSDPNPSSVEPDPDDISQGPPVDPKTNTPGEYGARQPVDTAPSNKPTQFDTAKNDEPSQLTGEDAWERRTVDDRKVHYDDRTPNLPQSQASTYDSRPPNGATTSAATDTRIPPAEDRPLSDRDRDRDRDRFIDRDKDRDWDRDRDRHDSIRDSRDRDRNRDVRDRRPDFFGRSYGRSHAPRPPPELRHYEPSYGPDYVPPPRRYDPDDKRGGIRNDDRPKPPPFDDRRPPFDDRRPPPSSVTADDRRLTLDDRPSRPLPGSNTRALPPSSEDRTRPLGDSIPLSRAAPEDNRSAPAASLIADDRPRAHVPLEERLSQPAPTPSLQDRLSQPTRVDIASAPSLEERLTLGPVLPRAYVRATSVSRDDLRAPLHKDDPRDHDRISDYRTSRDFCRERPGGPLPTASTYRPDLDRSFRERYDRDRRDRDVADMDIPSARFGDAFSSAGPLLPRRYSPPPPMFDRDRERERGRAYYPTRSPPPFRGEGVYDPDGERRYTTDRERDLYEQRRRDWYGPGDDDKRGLIPPPPASWRPHEGPPLIDRDRDRFDRERERDRDMRERDREQERDRDRDRGGLAPPSTRGQWDRDRRGEFSHSPPHSRMDTTGGIGPGRSLSARLADPHLPPPSGGNGSDERAYLPPPREFDRGRYGGPALDDHPHGPFSRVRGRSPSLPRRGPVLAEAMRPPMKRMREDSGLGYPGVGLGGGGASAAYSPPRRGTVSVGGGMGGGVTGEYAPGPPPSSAATTTSVVTSVSGTALPRSAGTRTPPVSAPPPSSSASSAFYERDREREREQREREPERDRDREREYVRGEYGMRYDRDGRGRRSPLLLGSRMGPSSGSGGYGRGVIGDRRDDRRYVPPPPRTS